MGLIREPLGVDLLIAPKKISKKHLDELDKVIANLKLKKKGNSGRRSAKDKQAA